MTLSRYRETQFSLVISFLQNSFLCGPLAQAPGASTQRLEPTRGQLQTFFPPQTNCKWQKWTMGEEKHLERKHHPRHILKTATQGLNLYPNANTTSRDNARNLNTGWMLGRIKELLMFRFDEDISWLCVLHEALSLSHINKHFPTNLHHVWDLLQKSQGQDYRWNKIGTESWSCGRGYGTVCSLSLLCICLKFS